MKNLYAFLLTFMLFYVSYAQVLASETFSYPDGPLVGNGSWNNTSGTANTLLVSSGQAVLEMDGSAPEDANLTFNPVSGNIFYGLDFTVFAVTGNIGGADREIFAHFLDETFSFTKWRARLDVVSPTGSGDYSIGLATAASNAEEVWPTDLTFGVQYRAIVRYDQNEDIAELWINASTQSDPSILGVDLLTPLNMVAFGLRQSDSQLNETVLVDNIIVSSTFNEVLSTRESVIKDFKLFPNPVNSNVQKVYITTKLNSTKHIEVFNIIGKKIYETVIHGKELNISKLTSGIYLLKITENNITETRKLIVK